MAVGKITGQMLGNTSGNLERDGVDLVFDNDLIYLDVTNRKVGIKTTSPNHELTVNGTTRSTNLEATNSATLGNIVVTGDQIYSNTGVLNFNLTGGGQVVYQNRLQVDDIQIEGNRIATINSNADLELTANGTGTINLNSNVEVFGDLHATGTITADGNLQLGDANTDNITFNADIASNVTPDVTDTYKLGSSTKRWNDVWVNNLYAESVATGAIEVAGINIGLSQGNIYYVAVNGADDNGGTHQQDPLSSVGRALDLASAGDTVYIYPGTYSETLPLVVPAGVTVKGAGIRSVTIQPDSDVTVDMFHLNGETTIEDLTISGFEYDVGTNTGYAFRFASNMTVTTRSPYIRNVSVITAGSTVRLMTNPVDDPLGFLAGDAGKGAYIDGSVVNAASNEASMLFSGVTFITPGVDALTMTNGVRIEWLNSFTYFSNRSMYLTSGSTGFAGDGKTRVKINTRTGTFAVGNTLTYYDTDGTTVLATGTIESVDGNFFVIDGKSAGWETLADRIGKTISVNGDAKLNTSVKKFGTASLSLDGTGDYLSVGSQPDFAYGTGDFTIELQYYPNNFSNFRVLFDQRTAAPDNTAYIDVTPAGAVRYIVASSSIVSTSTLTVSAWNHIAVSRVSSTTRLFINGVLQASTLADTTNYAQKGVRIGGDYAGNAAYWVNGYIDELRITKGLGRYTTTFTAPTAAFLGDTDTVLLLHFNGVNNSTQIVDDGNTFQDIRTSAGGTASVIDVVDYADFGAEVRSIGSAAVYGNYGIYGDGDGVIVYLIGQNLAYIGNGKETTNDPNTVIQANEVVELNRAKIYYNSVDHKGDFRVGDLFYVNQSTGEVTFSNSSVTIGTSLTFDNGSGNITYIDATKIETGNIRISGNTIESTTGGLTLTAANSEITSTSNVTITGTLDVVQDVNFNGNTVIGDSSSDTVTFNSQVNSNVVPSTNTTYNLGSTSKQWQNVYLAEAIVDDISISGNVITTTVSNSNLELRANGTGAVRVDTLDFKSNAISSNSTNADININPNGTGKIQLLKDTDITGNLGVTGNITLGGNIQIGDNSSDTINLVGSITNNLIPSVTGNFNIGSSGSRWKNIYLAEAIVDDISVSGNLITTTVSNSNLELRANGTGAVRVDTLDFKSNIISSNSTNADININPNGTGKIQLLKDTDITGNLSVTGNITLGGNIQIGDNSSDTINLVGSITNNLIPSVTGNFDIGSNSLRWRNLYASNVTVNDIEINDNYIRTVSSNADLELRANGTGVVSIPSNNVTIDQNLTVTSGTTTLNNTIVNGTLTTDNLIVNAPVIASSFGTGDIIVQGNVIQTTLSNSNLELRANGSGSIVLESLSVSSSTISGTVAGQDIELTPSGTGIVKINGNQSLQLPAGTDGDRPAVPTSGMIRFNSTANRYEGYNGSYWLQLGGISDVDRNTYIIPESTPGANDNTLYFYANNQLAATLDSTKFAPNKILVDDLEINGNVIRTTTTNTDLELRPNGTGAVVVDGFRITANTITNSNASVVTEFRSTGTGYYYIVGTNAVVIPSGGNGARPGAPQIGMIRFNTDLGLVEAWDGANWNSVAGATSGISSATANDIAATMALIFG